MTKLDLGAEWVMVKSGRNLNNLGRTHILDTITKFHGNRIIDSGEKIFKGFHHILEWQSSCDQDHLDNVSRLLEATHEIWLRSAQWFRGEDV